MRARLKYFGRRKRQVGLEWLMCLAVSAVVCSVNAQTPAQSAAQGPAQSSEVAKPDSKSDSKIALDAATSQQPVTDPKLLRQKQLADDTARLLELANQLKVEMDKSSKDTLSLNVIKKANEIEKLARKVRDEMKANIAN
jgi:hypothetical protein